MSSQNCRRVTGSTPPVGSSRKTTFGSWKIDTENESFCFHPNGNDFTSTSRSLSKPNSCKMRSVSDAIFRVLMP